MPTNYDQWPWTLVIPSYNRDKYLLNHTFAMCKEFGISEEHIYIFVATNQQKLYEETFKDFNIKIISGPVGLKNMRNYITHFFEEGVPLLCMDDDIDALYLLDEDESVSDKNKASHWKLKKLSSLDFYNFTMDAYTTMRENARNLFGIYPVKNGFFMKDLPDKTLNPRFCVGTFWGIINSHKKHYKITFEEKEDMERSIQMSVYDGGVLRYNHITLKTRYYKTAGGMQTHISYEDRIKNSFESSKKLYEKFANICSLVTSKKNGMCEIRFKKTITTELLQSLRSN
jgi:hypothetical protein